MQSNIVRLCNVLGALRARATARELRRLGFTEHAEQARELVRIHLRNKKGGAK